MRVPRRHHSALSALHFHRAHSGSLVALNCIQFALLHSLRLLGPVQNLLCTAPLSAQLRCHSSRIEITMTQLSINPKCVFSP